MPLPTSRLDIRMGSENIARRDMRMPGDDSAMNEFSLSVLRPGAPEAHAPFRDGRAEAWGIKASVTLHGEDLTVTLAGDGEAVVTLWLKPEGRDLFPILPVGRPHHPA